MSRFFIAALFALIAGNASAYTNEGLYLFCKDYAEKGFEAENPEDVACFSYFIAIGEIMIEQCEGFGGFKADFNANYLNASIQQYLNTVANIPSEWNYQPSTYVADAISKIAPKCQ